MITAVDNVQLLREMLATQDRLNTFLDKDWRFKPEIYQNKLAIFDEAAEILNAVNWKWWSKAKKTVDMEQVRLEVVDIWMFALADLWYEWKDRVKLPFTSVDKIPLAMINSVVLVYESALEILEGKTWTEEDIADAATMVGSEYNARHDAMSDITWASKMAAFFSLLLSTGMDFNSLYALYNRKAALNLLRWENGYGTTYQKQWRSSSVEQLVKTEEDNVWLMKIVEAFPDAKSVDQLLPILRKAYQLQLRPEGLGEDWKELLAN